MMVDDAVEMWREMPDEKSNLKVISIATPILLPVITWILINLTIEPRREYAAALGQFVIGILLMGTSIVFGLAAATQLQLKLKMMGSEGFWARRSTSISMILSIIIILGYFGVVYDLYESAVSYKEDYERYHYPEDLEIYKASLITIFEYLPFGLMLPLLSLYVAIQVKKGRERSVFHTISNLCYLGYIILPLYGVIDVFGVI
jgi:hypothetical protein